MKRVELVVRRTGVTKVMHEGAAVLLERLYPGRYVTRVMRADELQAAPVTIHETEPTEQKRRGRPPKPKD
jgi:hypothetical protein